MNPFFLVDCNNFYVSCERVFNPKLIGKPVVVLSNNDGCIIARSNEVKKMGVPMGAPAFEYKDLFKKQKVQVFSPNFSLYGDMSARVMDILSQYATDIEIYSIDEAFLFLDQKLFSAKFIQEQVKKKTGIPVSIGVGNTKTLAKIANKIAKKDSKCSGVFDLTSVSEIDSILEKIEVSDIWGIGRQYSKLLNSFNIYNAKELKYIDDIFARKKLSINGLKTIHELRGISCIDLNTNFTPNKSIVVSRTFGRHITKIEELNEAVATFTSDAAEKLREQNLICSTVTVFLVTCNFYDYERSYISSRYEINVATSYTPDLIASVLKCVQNLFKSGTVYKKAGVLLTNIYPENFVQTNILNSLSINNDAIKKQKTVIKIFDQINQRFGNDTVIFASAGISKDWLPKRANKTPCYTTNWHELLKIKI